jgi:nucleoside-diphosphate-sugar epimerase
MTLDEFPSLSGLGATALRAEPYRIVVAGAGGWMGLATLEALSQLLGDEAKGRVVCFGSSHRDLTLRNGASFEQFPLPQIADLPPKASLVLHFAFLTQEKAAHMSAEAYVEANRAISDHVINSLDRIGAVGLYVASSGAIEMADRPGANPNKALYGRLKLQDETRAREWAITSQRRTVISRIYGLSGPYMNKIDAYALGCFIMDALAERSIIIKADHPVFRSYVALNELMSIVFGLLTDGGIGTTLFDTGADRGLEMGEIAAAVVSALDHRAGVQRPPITRSERDWYVGDGCVYQALRDALKVDAVGLADQVRQTARFLKVSDYAESLGPRAAVQG